MSETLGMQGDNDMAIKFCEIKKYLSRVVRLSICFEDGHYDNYTMVSDIPEGKYDDLFVYGIGMIDVEFPLDVYAEPKEFPQKLSDGFYWGCGLEIAVRKEPRDIDRLDEKELTFGDFRDYLQHSGNFSIVIKEGWEEENYEWREDISESYNDMYVYGIGIEDNPEELLEVTQEWMLDSNYVKKLRIVVSERPRD